MTDSGTMKRVLLVEDNAGDAALITRTLDGERPAFAISHAESLAQAGAHLQATGFAAVLLDLGLPDATGFEALDAVTALAPSVPVVVVTGHCEEEAGVAAVRRGAQDFVSKDALDSAFLVRALRFAIEREQILNRLESENHALQWQAQTDMLTGLPNRRAFLDALGRELHRRARHGNPLALAMCDLDHFKQVNDAHGHRVGDEVLSTLSSIARHTLREEDLMGRLGGEEFAILMPETRLDHALAAAERLRAGIGAGPFETTGGPVPITVSIGVATVDRFVTDPAAALEIADTALYRAKVEGRNRVLAATDTAVQAVG